MDNLSIKQLKYIIPIFFIGAVVLYFLLGKITSDTFKNYPLVKSDESINAIVLESKEYKGFTLIKDSNKKCFSVSAFNWEEKKYVLHYHLERGDSIVRESFSDTLYLYKKKNNRILKFEIDCLE